VTYKYHETGGHVALRNVSLEIPANSLVLLVGENGSGKSTLLKLLARLQEPQTGNVFIDGTPIKFYELSSIRKHINFLMQSEDIYPLSLKENLLMVVPDRKNLGEKVQEKMDEAIRLGGSEKLVERVGYDAVLNPPNLLAQSLQGCGNGPAGSAALRELEKHTQRRLISVSHGEKQRFIAYVGGSIILWV
jgi:ABC-type multidrug transport system fused ATPase/permease subunit